MNYTRRRLVLEFFYHFLLVRWMLNMWRKQTKKQIRDAALRKYSQYQLNVDCNLWVTAVGVKFP